MYQTQVSYVFNFQVFNFFFVPIAVLFSNESYSKSTIKYKLHKYGLKSPKHEFINTRIYNQLLTYCHTNYQILLIFCTELCLDIRPFSKIRFSFQELGIHLYMKTATYASMGGVEQKPPPLIGAMLLPTSDVKNCVFIYNLKIRHIKLFQLDINTLFTNILIHTRLKNTV